MRMPLAKHLPIYEVLVMRLYGYKYGIHKVACVYFWFSGDRSALSLYNARESERYREKCGEREREWGGYYANYISLGAKFCN